VDRTLRSGTPVLTSCAAGPVTRVLAALSPMSLASRMASITSAPNVTRPSGSRDDSGSFDAGHAYVQHRRSLSLLEQLNWSIFLARERSMSDIIIPHGHRFIIEADGFGRAGAEADRDVGVSAIEMHLQQMPSDEVAAIHAAALAWQDGDMVDERPAALDYLERVGMKAATAGWRDASQVGLSVSAVA